MSEFWTEGVKAVAAALTGAGSFWVGGRAWRQIDRKRQAESEGDARIVRAESDGQVEAISRFEKLATLAEERAARAEARELAAIERADRYEELMRAAVKQADEAERRAARAEAEVKELKDRVARLENNRSEER
ncbi:hypothetical protein [Caballeronia sp. LZ043]|uniref:hypothetical protein n=1 Tax=Caballeronia sp. LZ043 TaxID=3038569 RepID=UPI0028596983|nr:hypothetical protein [Caballeronia sp. LZ043]MDR5825778.1 hypothetical protein [Caballeronia sp. LZ043]